MLGNEKKKYKYANVYLAYFYYVSFYVSGTKILLSVKMASQYKKKRNIKNLGHDTKFDFTVEGCDSIIQNRNIS